MNEPENDAEPEPVDHLPGGTGEPLDADEGEPDVQPFGGDDDIRSGQYGPGE